MLNLMSLKFPSRDVCGNSSSPSTTLYFFFSPFSLLQALMRTNWKISGYLAKVVSSLSLLESSSLFKGSFQNMEQQGRRSHLKSEGAQGGYFFSCNFLLLFWAICENDLFSKSQKVGGLKPPLPLLVRRP